MAVQRFRERIALAIKGAPLPQGEIAARLGVGPDVVSKWANEKSTPSPPSHDKLLRDMGRRIAAYRKKKGWNQTELGRRVGIRQETVSRWENGATQPTIVEIVGIARALGVTLDELVLGR